MTKKQGKSKIIFRYTKKNVLHKKRVNSKKRGLRGGEPSLIIDPDNTLHSYRNKFTWNALKRDECDDWISLINTYEQTNKMNVKLNPGSQGYKDYYGCLNLLYRNVTFNTSLTTDKNPGPTSQTLTLKGCKAIKNPLLETSMFKYKIVSPTATTKPPMGGTQNETHVGTFTQLPISYLLSMSESTQKPLFSFVSFYKGYEDRKSYFIDYLSCLENVKKNFGPNIGTKGLQLTTFRTESKLRSFGKNIECKIVLVAGNVGSQIQAPENDGAIFVIASQLNGAEYTSPKPVENLDNYKSDTTGGPVAQLSCHPAVAEFIRIHAARTDFDSYFLVINAIDDVIKSLLDFKSISGMTLVLNNGYLQVSNDLRSINFTLSVSSKSTQDIFDLFCQKLKVLQTDDVPTSGLTPANIYLNFNSEAKSKVTLIYASAVPLNYNSDPPINPEKSTLQYCVAGFDLVAQYFGAMVSAYNKKKQRESDVGEMAEKAAKALDTAAETEAQTKHIAAVNMATNKVKLFLTPLGGGVFQNPREMIACSALLAYYQAKQLLLDFDDKVQIIFLAWDGNSDEVKDFNEFFNTKEDLEAAAVQRDLDYNHPSNVSPNKLPGEDLVSGDDADADAGTLSDILPKLQQPVAAATLPEAATLPVAVEGPGEGGSKSRRRHRRHRKPARKTRRGHTRKSKPKSKTHRRRRIHKNKKYTRKH